VWFSWEVGLAAGGLLVLMAVVALFGRRPARSSRSAYEWLVLRDRIDALEARVHALEATPGRPVPEPTPRVIPPARFGPRTGTADTLTRPQSAPALRQAPATPTSAHAPPTLITVPDLGPQRASSVVAASGSSPTLEDEFAAHYERVGRLADRGLEGGAIARDTGLPLDRVEWILGLRRQWADPRYGPRRGAPQSVPGTD
jgi:hypothetical protein